ncbi:MAG: hypothetical protein ACUVWZ_05105 [Anaerolineae bacterium]
MSRWVIPYVDQELDFWIEIRNQFGDQIREVYFPMPGRQFASGRSPQPQQFLVDFLRHAPLPKSVLLNPILLDQPVEEVAPSAIAALRHLREEFGIQSVTIANLSLACRIREVWPDLFITASVLMGISTPLQVLMVRDGVDAISPDTRVLRDLAALKRLRAAFSGEVRLLVNEACLPGCPFRIQHFYEMGYGSHYPQSLCQELLAQHPWLRLTGAWVLPRHLKFYDGLYDSLKLAGRVTLRDPDRYFAVLGAYIRCEPILPTDIGGGPASPPDGVDASDEWFNFVLHCDKRCDICSVCRDYYAQFHAAQEGRD